MKFRIVHLTNDASGLFLTQQEKADVMRIQMDIVGFRYKPGQYLYLNCPALSKHEWHPFTITSAPEEGFVSVHIRTRGDWTSRLKEHICPQIPEDEALASASSNPMAVTSSPSGGVRRHTSVSQARTDLHVIASCAEYPYHAICKLDQPLSM